MTTPTAPRRLIRSHRWPPERLARLDRALDRGLTDAQAARRFQTTKDAVLKLRHRRGIEPSGARFLTASEVAARLGWRHPKVVLDWLHAGYLPARRQPNGGFAEWRWLISEDALTAFLADPEHWHRWDEWRIADPALREWATELRGGYYLTTREVAERFHVWQTVVVGWIAKGELPARRRGGDKSGQWLVRAADLAGFVVPSLREPARLCPEDRDAIWQDWRTGRLSPAGLAFWYGVAERDVRRLIAEREKEQVA